MQGELLQLVLLMIPCGTDQHPALSADLWLFASAHLVRHTCCLIYNRQELLQLPAEHLHVLMQVQGQQLGDRTSTN